LLGQDEADLDIDVYAERVRREARAAEVLAEALRAEPALASVGAEALARLPAYAVEVDARAAARYGVGRAEVVAALEAAAGGRDAAALAATSEPVPVRVAVTDAPTLTRVLEQRVPRAAGPAVPLRLLVRASEAPVPAVLVRADLQPVLRLTADVAPGATLPAAEAAVRRALAPHLRAGEDVRVRGLAEAFRESLRQAGWALVLSLALVYLLLAAQFESLRLPLVVLAVVPLSLAGVALTLALTGHGLDVMSLTGAVVLTGIVVNDAILKVSFAERERAAGRAVHAAIRAAGRARFRPILMTTITTVLGLLPVALQRGDAAVQAPLAVAVIGGLLVSTVLALLVVPVFYTALAPRPRRLRRRRLATG
ncbi:MAG: efflux RND transporter permease subunit, partial [Rubricoccaceae bacterium]